MSGAHRRATVGFIVLVLTGLLLCLATARPSGAHVFWGDWDGVGRSELDGGSPFEDFVANGATYDLAARDGWLYWFRGSGELRRVTADGSEVQQLLLNTTLPRGVATDGAHVYWSDGPSIGRADLDGSNIEHDFVALSGRLPSKIAVDGHHIFWISDGPRGRDIGRANLDGSGVDPDWVSSVDPDSGGLAAGGGHVYWGSLSGIGRIGVDGTGRDDTFLDAGVWVGSLAVDGQYLYFREQPSPFDQSSVGRVGLDGSGLVHQVVMTSSQPTQGLAVDAGVSRPTTTTLSVTPVPTAYGSAQELTATVADAGPSATRTPVGGSVVFSVDGVRLGDRVPVDGDSTASLDVTGLDVGMDVDARFAGDGDHSTSDDRRGSGVTPAATTMTLESSANPLVVRADDDGVLLTASVANTSTAVSPFGSVQFSIDGQPLDEPIWLDDAGHATYRLDAPPPGQYVISADYVDDTAAIADFSPSHTTLVQHVQLPAVAHPTPAPTSSAPTVQSPTAAVVAPRPVQHPTRPSPNSRFVINAIHVTHGAVHVTLTTNDPGRLTTTASSRALQPSSFARAEVRRLPAGRTTLIVTPNSRARSTLKRTGRLSVSLLLTYQSTNGGAPSSRRRTVVVRVPVSRRPSR